jgi:L-arabinose isomerase
MSGNHYEQVQSGFSAGYSLLTANGIPCAGEGDVKIAIAMKICDTLGVGGSFSEIAATDYVAGTIILGHDGPFHIKIAESKPVLRGMAAFYGKRGSGVPVEANARAGDVTTLGIAQTGQGRLKAVISEGEAVKEPMLMVGNTQTHVRLKERPDLCMDRFAEAPTNHFAMSVGKNASVLQKAFALLGVEQKTLRGSRDPTLPE